jgi:hypothetical protein
MIVKFSVEILRTVSKMLGIKSSLIQLIGHKISTLPQASTSVMSLRYNVLEQGLLE